jgi:hypothetical protein
MIGAAILMLMQQSPTLPQGMVDTRPEPFPEVFEESDRAPATRKALALFAQCVAEQDAERARALLLRDFRPTSYRNALERLVRDNYPCMARTGHRSLGSTRLPVSAALAEHLIEQDATPLNVRLARAVTGKPAATFAPSDAAAMCVAKSAPDDVGKLFATEPDSEAETAVAGALTPVLAACARAVGSPPIEATPFGLRSIVASASYRLLAAQGASE